MSGARVPLLVLGAGPAGLGVAWKLAARGIFDVTVIERNSVVGGNAGSFDLGGMRVDFGSHRLHPACPPEILDDIRRMLGADLLDRPRHGRIHLRGRWLRFPLKPFDLLRNLPPSFTLGVVRDALPRRTSGSGQESFATLMERGLGRTICRDFYFPYAEKIWGMKADELDVEQARRRVSANSISKVIGKVLSTVPGFRRPGAGRFFYPRGGYGQISEAYRRAALEAGARIELDTAAETIEVDGGRAVGVVGRRDGAAERFAARHVLATIPIPFVARAIRPSAPAEILEATERLRYRAMILIYLVVGVDRFTEYDAHYFPALNVPISRMSEPKNYGLAQLPGKTILCAELPCSTTDAYWKAGDEELAAVFADSLAAVGLPQPAPIMGTLVRRLSHAYPAYARGYSAHFEALDGWLGEIEGLTCFGRQGLFAHDNTHHTLAMAYALADCIDDAGDLDRSRWAEARKVFEAFVVED